MTTLHGTSAGLLLAGRYELLVPLGRGATAEVWRARDNVLARDVAIKLFDDRTMVAEAQGRRAHEMQVLAGLTNPGLVTLFDAGDDGGTTFLVMELVNGPTLARAIADGPLDAGLTATIGLQLAETLTYVHARRVVHRDVKPANVLLARHDDAVRAKLADFGVARLLDHTRMTADGATLGTANYLSPEQARGDEIGPPSDVFALGLILIECLTASPAYPGHGIEAAVARLLRAPYLPDDIADEWRVLLTRMTAMSPDDRPSTLDVVRELRAIGRGTASASTVAETAELRTVTPTRRRHRRGLAVLVAAGVCAAVTTVVAMATLDTTPAVSSPATTQPRTPAAGSTTAPPRTRAAGSPAAATRAVAVTRSTSHTPSTATTRSTKHAVSAKHRKRSRSTEAATHDAASPARPAPVAAPGKPGRGPGPRPPSHPTHPRDTG